MELISLLIEQDLTRGSVGALRDMDLMLPLSLPAPQGRLAGKQLLAYCKMNQLEATLSDSVPSSGDIQCQ